MTINSIDSNIPIEISKGGTDSASFTTVNGVVSYNGTSLVASPEITIASNIITNPAQPAFSAYKSAISASVTGNGAVVTVVYDTVMYDRESSYNNSTGYFTAPENGYYSFNASAFCSNPSSCTYAQIFIVTPSYTFTSRVQQPSGNQTKYVSRVVFVQLTTGQQVYVQFAVYGQSGNTANIYGNATNLYTTFSGYLIC